MRSFRIVITLDNIDCCLCAIYVDDFFSYVQKMLRFLSEMYISVIGYSYQDIVRIVKLI